MPLGVAEGFTIKVSSFANFWPIYYQLKKKIKLQEGVLWNFFSFFRTFSMTLKWTYEYLKGTCKPSFYSWKFKNIVWLLRNWWPPSTAFKKPYLCSLNMKPLMKWFLFLRAGCRADQTTKNLEKNIGGEWGNNYCEITSLDLVSSRFKFLAIWCIFLYTALVLVWFTYSCILLQDWLR